MADNWYYVQKGNRHGPVAVEVIQKMIADDELKTEDFVWKKGFENWKKIQDVPELEETDGPPAPAAPPKVADMPTPIKKDLSFKDVKADERIIYIRIGSDRGGDTTDYGPFNIKQLKQLFKENRINAKTYVFIMGAKEWKILADFPEYQEIFEELPPVLQESEKESGR